MRAATSVDEVNQLVYAITGCADWENVYARRYAARHIGETAREALADPSTDLCRRRLQREFTELQ